MQRPQPMNRLLQGDVGSGKTIVALMAALVAMENGFQVAFMAPTEILAEQHFLTIRRLLETSRFRIALADRRRRRRRSGARCRRELAGGVDPPGRRHARAGRRSRSRSASSGSSIIDEQHRFGVLQRATLRAKGLHPDVLVMTATPIPRTLALTTYGDLDVSVIREMPPGRQPITTMAQAGVAARRDLRRSSASELDAGPAGLRHLSAGRGVGEGRSAGRRPRWPITCAQDVFPDVPRRAAARPHEAGREGPRDGARSRAASSTSSSRRPSSKSASTCRTRR